MSNLFAGLDDEEEFSLNVKGGSGLSFFNKSPAKAAEPAPKQTPTPVQTPPPAASSPVVQPAAVEKPSILFAVPGVSCFKYNASTGKYDDEEKIGGAAILGVLSRNIYTLLLYKSNTVHVCTTPITSEFAFTVQNETYGSFSDHTQQAWSIHFPTFDSVSRFAVHIAIAKALSGNMNKIYNQDIKVGEGKEIVEGDRVKIKYVGYVITNGKAEQIFDSNLEKERPASITVGAGKAVPGIESGIVGMTKKSRRAFVVPASQAYGAKGFEGRVPPNSHLAFQVDVVGIKAPGSQRKEVKAESPEPASTNSNSEDVLNRVRKFGVALGPMPGIADHAASDSHNSDAQSQPQAAAQPADPQSFAQQGQQPGYPQQPGQPGQPGQGFPDPNNFGYQYAPGPYGQPAQPGYPQQPGQQGAFSPAHWGQPNQFTISPNSPQQQQQQQQGMPNYAPTQYAPVNPNDIPGDQLALFSSQFQAFMRQQQNLGVVPPTGAVPPTATQVPQPTTATSESTPVTQERDSDKTVRDSNLLDNIPFSNAENNKFLHETRMVHEEIKESVFAATAKIEQEYREIKHSIFGREDEISKEKISGTVLIQTVGKIVEENEQLQKEVVAKADKIDELREKLSSLLEKNKLLIEEHSATMEERNNSLTEANEQAKKMVNQLREEKLKLDTNLQLVADDLSRTRTNVSKLTYANNELSSILAETKSDINNVKSQLNAKRSEKISESSQLNEVRLQLRDATNERKNLVLEFEATEEKLRESVEALNKFKQFMEEQKRKWIQMKAQIDKDHEDEKAVATQKMKTQLLKFKKEKDDAVAEAASIEQETEMRWRKNIVKLKEQFKERVDELRADLQQDKEHQLSLTHQQNRHEVLRLLEDTKLTAQTQYKNGFRAERGAQFSVASKAALLKNQQQLDIVYSQAKSFMQTSIKKLMSEVYSAVNAEVRDKEHHSGADLLTLLVSAIKEATVDSFESIENHFSGKHEEERAAEVEDDSQNVSDDDEEEDLEVVLPADDDEDNQFEPETEPESEQQEEHEEEEDNLEIIEDKEEEAEEQIEAEEEQEHIEDNQEALPESEDVDLEVDEGANDDDDDFSRLLTPNASTSTTDAFGDLLDIDETEPESYESDFVDPLNAPEPDIQLESDPESEPEHEPESEIFENETDFVDPLNAPEPETADLDEVIFDPLTSTTSDITFEEPEEEPENEPEPEPEPEPVREPEPTPTPEPAKVEVIPAAKQADDILASAEKPKPAVKIPPRIANPLEEADNIFGETTSSSKSDLDTFAQPKTKAPTADVSDIFGSSTKAATPAKPAVNVDDLFGSSTPKKPSATVNVDDLFGGSSTPKKPTVNVDDLFGSPAAPKKASTPSKTNTDDLFGVSAAPKKAAKGFDLGEDVFSSGGSGKKAANLDDLFGAKPTGPKSGFDDFFN